MFLKALDIDILKQMSRLSVSKLCVHTFKSIDFFQKFNFKKFNFIKKNKQFC